MKSFLQTLIVIFLSMSLLACGGSDRSGAASATVSPVSAAAKLVSSTSKNEAAQKGLDAIADDQRDVQAGLRNAFTVDARSAVARRQKAQRLLARLGSVPVAVDEPWDGKVTINLELMAGSTTAESNVYWAIVGRDWGSNQFVHVDRDGRFVDMALADNGALVKNGQSYTNYFHSLAELKSVTIPALNSARILLSVGGPMYIAVNTDINGNLGYAGANIENPSDPNIDVMFDFVEFAIVDQPFTKGIWANTTRVDHFGFPVRLRLEGDQGYVQTVGEDGSLNREQLFDRFVKEVPAAFGGLVKPPFRIVAPAHDSFHAGNVNAHYLDEYIDQIWEQYKTQSLEVDIELGHFTGRVQEDGRMVFTDALGEYVIRRKPSTSEALLGNGVLDDAGDLAGLAKDKQLQLQAQLCAALNRHVAENSTLWKSHDSFYQQEPNNSYAAFWHRYNIDALSYGFAYDDVSDASASLYSSSPRVLTVSVLW